MLPKNILLLLLFSFLSPRTTLGCSCIENFMSKPRRSTICDGFEREDNVLAVTVQTSYSKCLVYNSTVYDPFSCLKYEYVDGVVTVTTQETFSCNETSPQYYRYFYRPCGDVAAEITGSIDQSLNLVRSPITDLSGEPKCGFIPNVFDNYEEGSGCDLTIQPIYYTLSITEVFKGNYKVGDVITSSGPDVLTSCGNPNAVLAFGQEYIMGIGGACEPINNWSPVSGYTPEDMEFIRRAAGNIDVCDSTNVAVSSTVVSNIDDRDSANVVVSSIIVSLAISIFILFISN